MKLWKLVKKVLYCVLVFIFLFKLCAITMAKRISYFLAFKLQVLHYAKANGNIATAREFNVGNPSIQLWRNKEKKVKKFHPKSPDSVTWACMVHNFQKYPVYNAQFLATKFWKNVCNIRTSTVTYFCFGECHAMLASVLLNCWKPTMSSVPIFQVSEKNNFLSVSTFIKHLKGGFYFGSEFSIFCISQVYRLLS